MLPSSPADQVSPRSREPDTLRQPVVVRRISRERVVVLGWSRAILLQFAHPLLAAGVSEHSSFRGSAPQAVTRLHQTVSAMLSLVFDRPTPHAAAINRIRAIHKTVRGTLKTSVGRFPAGTPYSAEDPALLLWVHATLLDSTADIFQRVVAPLTPDDLDTFCVESAPVLHELGGDPTATPLTWSALQTYLTDMYRSGVLAIGEQGSALAHAVLSPRAAGVGLPFFGVQRLLTIGLLPSDIRRAYGFDWSTTHQRRFERNLRLLRRLRRAAPPVLAHWRPARASNADPGRH